MSRIEEILAVIEPDNYYLLIDLKNLLNTMSPQTILGRLRRMLRTGAIEKQKAWAFRSNKFFYTNLYYLPSTPPPPDVWSYPFQEQIEADKTDLATLRANHIGSPQSFYNWLDKLVKLGVLNAEDVAFATRPDKSGERYSVAADSPYLKWPLARQWLLEQVAGRYAE